MAWIQPNSTIHLLQNIPLTNAYIHTVDYSNATAQYNDFISYKIASFNNYTYIRNNTLKIEGQISSLYAVNYMMFKNTAYENKWWYAFVTNVSYLNDNTVILTYEIDVMQSFLFDYMTMPSYIERETVEHDTIFANLTEEELEIGEYELKERVHPNYFNAGNLCAIVGVSRKISDSTGDFEISANLLYGMPTYETYYLFTTPLELQNFYQYYASNGNTEDLLEMVLFPSGFVRASDWATDSQGFKYFKSTDGNGNPLSPNYVSMSLPVAVKGTTAFQSYIPKNAKMYNSPYFKVICTDLEGNAAEYSPEYFYTSLNSQATDPNMQDTTKMYFILSMPVNSIPQPVVMPQFYKTKDFVYNKNYIFIGTAFGQMPLLTDTYAAWYAMNSAQLQNQYNILASNRNYIARSGAANSGIASLAAQSAGINLNTETIATQLGLNSGIGPQVAGFNLINAAGAAGRAVSSLSGGLNAVWNTVTGNNVNSAEVLSVTDTLQNNELTSGVNSAVQEMSTAGIRQADISARQARIQAGLAGIRENYDNTQAQLAIQGLQAKITDAQTMSPSVRGMGNSNISAALTNKGITLMLCCITDDYAKRIDNYLSVYGYKVNRFGTINTKSRQNWNYIKTVGANILNNGITTKLPHSARITIRNIYDNGVTFWHGGLAMVYRYGTFDNPEV